MQDNSSSDKPPPDPLTEIGLREHAALKGLLAERNELITHGNLYIGLDGSPPVVGHALDIDSGVMLIAITRRLGGDEVEAERALKDAIWSHMKSHGIDLENKTLDDIDLAIPKIMLGKWKENPDDWFAQSVWAACGHLQGPIEKYDRKGSSEIVGIIGGDVWRLYAGTLSVLGESTDRRWFGD